MDNETILFSLLKAGICGDCVSDSLKQVLEQEDLSNVYELAHKHNLGHIVGHVLGGLKLLSENALADQLRSAALQAYAGWVRKEQAFASIRTVFEQGHVPFLPLKGALLRTYYPEPWLRNSCDIDILVPKQQLETATALLEKKLGFTNEGIGSHDVSLRSNSGVHVELHYDLIEDTVSKEQSRVLSDVWKEAVPAEGTAYEYRMPDAMFYFYHISHMAKHFQNGGCGIRSVLDTWILNHRIGHDRALRVKLLEQGGLQAFADAAEKLAEVWFGCDQADAFLRQFGAYVIAGGVYGTLENKAAVTRSRKGRVRRYFISRFFLPLEVMKWYYPVLEKHKWLLPACHIARWCRILVTGNLRRPLHEMVFSGKLSERELVATEEMLNHLGL